MKIDFRELVKNKIGKGKFLAISILFIILMGLVFALFFNPVPIKAADFCKDWCEAEGYGSNSECRNYCVGCELSSSSSALCGTDWCCCCGVPACKDRYDTCVGGECCSGLYCDGGTCTLCENKIDALCDPKYANSCCRGVRLTCLETSPNKGACKPPCNATYECDPIWEGTCHKENGLYGIWEWGPTPSNETTCDDLYDNDCDGYADCADSDCEDTLYCKGCAFYGDWVTMSRYAGVRQTCNLSNPPSGDLCVRDHDGDGKYDHYCKNNNIRAFRISQVLIGGTSGMYD